MENDSSNLDPSQAPSLAQPLVFSNSKQSTISQPASGNTFSHHNMVSRKHGVSYQILPIHTVIPSSDKFGAGSSFVLQSSPGFRDAELGS